VRNTRIADGVFKWEIDATATNLLLRQKVAVACAEEDHS
jgi:hypothetical protein